MTVQTKPRRIISLLVALTLMLGTLSGIPFSFPAFAAGGDDVFAGGSGTQAAPYIIETAAQLDAVRDYLGETNADKYFALGCDIDLTDYIDSRADWGTSGWLPIGYWGNTFLGKFNGAGHKITGLWIDRTTTGYVGLFSFISSGGSVSDLGVEGDARGIKGQSQVGGIAGLNDGTITGCYNTGAVTGNSHVGGVAGINWKTITGCYNTGAVNGEDINVGGVAGYNDGDITNSYNTGAVNGTGSVGGVAGVTVSGTITNCYNTGAVTGTSSVGGVAGDNSGSFAKITNCHNTGAVTGDGISVGGVVGYTWISTITNCYYDNEKYTGNGIGVDGGTATNVTGLPTAEMSGTAAASLVGFDFGDTWVALGGSELCCGPADYYPQLKVFAESEDAFTKNMSRLSTLATVNGGAPAFNPGEQPFVYGDGSDSDPYEVCTAGQLNHVRGHMAAGTHFQMQNDIETGGLLSENSPGWNDGAGWLPIGNNSNRFYGNFNGAGHKITGLWIDRTTTDNVGLFAYIGSGGRVSDLGVEGDSRGIKGRNHVGGVAGNNYGSITNCYNTGAVNGDGNNVGGVAGHSEGAITSCYNTGAVTGTDTVGGVAGGNDGSVTGCYNTGAVNGNNPVGGVAGDNWGTITSCYNTGTVKGPSHSFVGGVAGQNSSGTITNCYNTGAVTGNIIGGVAGQNSSGTITSCYYNTDSYNGNAVGEGTGRGDQTGGLTTAQMTASDTLESTGAMPDLGDAFVKPVYSADDVGCCTTGFYPELAVFAESADDYTRAMSKISVVSGGGHALGTGEQYFTHGDGTEDHPYLIYTAGQLSHVRTHMSSGTNLKMMVNIDLTGWLAQYSPTEGWLPIGDDSNQFFGKFNGAGHKITGLWINRPTTVDVGLFGVIGSDGRVSDLGVEGDSRGIKGRSHVGGVAGNNYGSITNCYNTGAVYGSNDVVGGVAGHSEGAITSCYNTGAVTGTGDFVGGVVGGNDGSVTNCYNTGAVNGNYEVGGVAGLNFGTITSCYNTGAVKGNSFVGGVAGGNNSTIANCYNTGAVTGNIDVGGVAGQNWGTITNSYNTGAITGTGNNIGGVAGQNYNGAITNCYYNTDSYNGNAIGYGTGSGGQTGGLTTAQMTASDTLESTGAMKDLGSAFEKRVTDDDHCYYPELKVFYAEQPTTTGQTASKLSVTVARRTPDLSGVTATILISGELLDKSVLNGSAKDPVTNDSVAGIFTWTNGTINPTDNTFYGYSFTPTYADLYKPAAGSAAVTVNAPSYYITIPTTVDLGNITRTENTSIASKTFTVSANNIPELGRTVSVSLSSDFKLKTITLNELGYKVFNVETDGTAIPNNGTFTTFTTNGDITGRVEVDQSEIRAEGAYSGTMTFNISLN